MIIRSKKTRLRPVICLLLVVSILFPMNLAASGRPQVTVEKTGGGIVRGDLIDVNIADEILLIKKSEELSGVKVPVAEIHRIRILKGANTFASGGRGLLFGVGLGVALGAVNRDEDGEAMVPVGIALGILLGSAGFLGGMLVGAGNKYKYKKFNMKHLKGPEHKKERRKILRYLNKRVR